MNETENRRLYRYHFNDRELHDNLPRICAIGALLSRGWDLIGEDKWLVMTIHPLE